GQSGRSIQLAQQPALAKSQRAFRDTPHQLLGLPPLVMAKNRALPVDAYIRDRPELAGPPSNANDLRLRRSLEEAGECTKVRRILQAENSAPANPGSFDRRAMLNFMTASLALGGLAGCAVTRQPFGAPLLSQPFRSPQHTPGVPLFFATSLELD